MQKDNTVSGILEEEYRRSRDVLSALSKKLSRYPKGSLNVRNTHLAPEQLQNAVKLLDGVIIEKPGLVG